MRTIIKTIFMVSFILTFNNCVKDNPIPTLTSITPSSKVFNMPDFTLTAIGTDFVDGAQIVFNGIEKPSSFISSTELSCQINTEDIQAISTIPVLVRNPTPGGGDSNSLEFTICSEHVFSNPRNISNNSGDSVEPCIIVDSDGNLNVVWEDYTPGNIEILFSRSTDRGTTWSLLKNISNNSGDSRRPTISIDSVGNLNAAWDDHTPGNDEILFSRSTDSGATWSFPINISNNSGDSKRPGISIDSVGTLYVAWDDHTTGNEEILFSRSTDSGATWSLPINISTNSGFSGFSTIIRDSGDNLYLVWDDTTYGLADVLFSRSTDSGSTWSLPINISHNPGASNHSTITVDGSGNLNAAWHDNTPGNPDVLFSRSTDGGATWSSAINISSNIRWSTSPSITADSAGNLYLAWADITPGNYEILFIRSTDNGVTWSLPINISDNSGKSYMPILVLDDVGNLNLAWFDNTFGNIEIFYCGSIQ